MASVSHKFYNTFAFLYPVIELLLGNHKMVLAEKVNSLSGMTLLEIGVGNGSYLHLYQVKYITAIDTSQAMLDRAKKKAPDAHLYLMDGEALSFDDSSFDSIVLCHVLAVTPLADRMLAEAYRVLKPGGYVFILNHFTPHNFIGFVDRAFRPLAKLLKFKSEFYLEHLDFSKFAIADVVPCGKLKYFKIIILRKP